jgi:hypothetical protein
MTRQLEILERHVTLSNEALAVFVRFRVTSTSPLPTRPGTKLRPKAASVTTGSSKLPDDAWLMEGSWLDFIVSSRRNSADEFYCKASGSAVAANLFTQRQIDGIISGRRIEYGAMSVTESDQDEAKTVQDHQHDRHA